MTNEGRFADEEKFAEEYVDALGEGPSERALLAQRARLLLRHQSGRARSGWSPRSLFGAGAALAGAGVLVAWLIWMGLATTQDSGPLQAEYEGRRLTTGDAVEASAGPGTLAFSDGSRVTLERGSSVRLQAKESARTALMLSRGSLHADVHRRKDARWEVIAGAYQVVVVGTAFRVTHDEQARNFEVAVERGLVRVLGPGLPVEGVLVPRGQRLSRSGASFHAPNDALAAETPTGQRPEHDARHAAESTPGPSEAPDAEQSAQGPSSPGRESPAAERPSVARPAAAMQSWQALASRGDYSGAVARAEEDGVSELLERASPGDLTLLGNAARFSGRTDLATRAYASVRVRFPKSDDAALAAYYRARLSLDAERNPRAAIAWLRTFLAESPGGELAATARARLMDLLFETGDRPGARRIAEEYLRLHPGGSHTSLARSLLDSPPSR